MTNAEFASSERIHQPKNVLNKSALSVTYCKRLETINGIWNVELKPCVERKDAPCSMDSIKRLKRFSTQQSQYRANLFYFFFLNGGLHWGSAGFWFGPCSVRNERMCARLSLCIVPWWRLPLWCWGWLSRNCCSSLSKPEPEEPRTHLEHKNIRVLFLLI